MRVLCAFLSFLLLPGITGAQVIIDQTDMPSPGDTLRLSVTNLIPVDFTQTGADTTWDFSMLAPLVQRVDTFIEVTPFTVPVAYYAVFGFGVSNLASPGNLVPPVPGVPVTHPLTFFHNGSAGYSDVGFAVTMMGIPVPLRYDNPELIYSFPLTTGSTWSSQSSVSIALPGLGAYYTSRQRSGIADGWGTLVTPYGTFQVIRVKSVLEEFDSIYIDSLGTGIPVHRSITQYQWLGKGQGVPLLEIDQEGPGATAYYRDHYHPLNGGMTVSIGPDTSVCPGSQLTLTAQVAGGFGPYHFIWSNFDTTKSITLTVDSSETIGVLAIDAVNDIAIGQVRITANCPGIEEKSWRSVEFFPNPSRGIIYALIPGSGTLQRFEISSLDGRKVLSGYPEPVSSQLFMIHAGGISPGEYLVRIWAGNKLYGGKIVLTTGNHP